MDSLKAKIVDLIDRDRFRPTGHFLNQCRERNATVEDALRVLRNGTHDPSRDESDPRWGDSYFFHGIDTKDKRRGVVVSLDEMEDQLILVTIYRSER